MTTIRSLGNTRNEITRSGSATLRVGKEQSYYVKQVRKAEASKESESLVGEESGAAFISTRTTIWGT